jgi:transposase
VGVAGIDPHKRTFTVAVLDERGGLHGVASFDTSQPGLAAGLAWLGAVEFDLDRVGVEGSAWLGSQVATFLAAAGDDVGEVQASRTAERRRRRRRAKTDAEDAQAIARETLAHPDLPPAGKQHTPDPDWDQLLALRNQRRSLIAQRRRLLNEAESVLVGLPLVVRAVLPATSQVRPQLRALARVPPPSSSSAGPTGSTWPGWPPPRPTSPGWMSASASSTSASPRCWRGIAAP